MLFRQTPKFVEILRYASEIAWRDIGWERLRDEAGLTCSRSTLFRFKDGTGELPRRLQGANAENLWNFLSRGRYTEAAIRRHRIAKPELYSMQEVANALSAFYAVHESQNANHYSRRGLCGTYLGYKMAFRKDGFVVKSRFEIDEADDEYFEIQEHQRSSGIFESDRRAIDENSSGFAFSKTNRLWMFLREVDQEQPRVFCFWTDKMSKISPVRQSRNSKIKPATEKITIMYGHVIEGSKRFVNAFASRFVVLVDAATDELLWKHKFPNVPYDLDEQIDIYPFEDSARKHYGDRAKRFHIEPDIAHYLRTGNVFENSYMPFGQNI